MKQIKRISLLICLGCIVISLASCNLMIGGGVVDPSVYHSDKSFDIMFEEKEGVNILKKEITLDTNDQTYGSNGAPVMMVNEKYYIQNTGSDTTIRALRMNTNRYNGGWGSNYNIKNVDFFHLNMDIV